MSSGRKLAENPVWEGFSHSRGAARVVCCLISLAGSAQMPALCSQDHACHEEDAVGCSTGSLSRALPNDVAGGEG